MMTSVNVNGKSWLTIVVKHTNDDSEAYRDGCLGCDLNATLERLQVEFNQSPCQGGFYFDVIDSDGNVIDW